MPKIENIQSEDKRNKLKPYKDLLEPAEIPVQRIFDFVTLDQTSLDANSTSGKAICYMLYNVMVRLDKLIELHGGERAVSTMPQTNAGAIPVVEAVASDAGSIPAASTPVEQTAEEIILELIGMMKVASSGTLIKALDGKKKKSTVKIAINKLLNKGLIESKRKDGETKYTVKK